MDPYQLETGDLEGRTDPHGSGKLETINDLVDATRDLEWSYVEERASANPSLREDHGWTATLVDKV